MTYRVPFVLASTAHGPMILSCIDFRPAEGGKVELGPGADLLFNAVYDRQQMAISNAFLQDRQRTHGNGVVAIDCGANIGAFTLEWARLMDGWGRVYAFEPQERVFYALAGNLAINNLFNAEARHCAVGRSCGAASIPVPDYCEPAGLGGVSMNRKMFIGQEPTKRKPVSVISIDSLRLPRVDLIKIDVEGMEIDVLEGAIETIKRDKPVLLVEWLVTGTDALNAFMASIGYETCYVGIDVICAPPGNDIMEQLQVLKKEQKAKEAA